MKRVFVLLLWSTLLAGAVFAQYRQRVSMSFGAGVAFPVDPADLSDNWKTGYGLLGELEVPIGEGEVSIVGAYHANTFPFDEEEFRSKFVSSGLRPQIISRISAPEASFWGLTIGGKVYMLRGRTFMRVDIGQFDLTRGVVSVVGPDTTAQVDFISKTGTLISLGAGLVIPVSETFDAVLEADYNIAKSDQDESTGYVAYYGSGGSGEIQRKNTAILNLRAVVRVKF
ncbi:MAG TPA: hypothetical protein VII11_05875 [Bacteroidota bacterium]